MKHLLKSTLLLVALAPTIAFSADSISVPVGSQSEELRRTILLPEYGQSMQSVEERLGAPELSDTIGQPAITKWRYKDMTVYFEGKTVLRTVVHFKPEDPAKTAIATKTQ